jgi:hypothetical protein
MIGSGKNKRMPRRKAINAVLHNFLATYASRYSDYGGYWLFGQIIDKFDRVEFDLLADRVDLKDPLMNFAAILATEKFAQQIKVAGFAPSHVCEAKLTLARSRRKFGEGYYPMRAGYRLVLAARAVSDLGKSFECEKWVFVAPHDPRIERQRSGVS